MPAYRVQVDMQALPKQTYEPSSSVSDASLDDAPPQKLQPALVRAESPPAYAPTAATVVPSPPQYKDTIRTRAEQCFWVRPQASIIKAVVE